MQQVKMHGPLRSITSKFRQAAASSALSHGGWLREIWHETAPVTNAICSWLQSQDITELLKGMDPFKAFLPAAPLKARVSWVPLMLGVAPGILLFSLTSKSLDHQRSCPEDVPRKNNVVRLQHLPADVQLPASAAHKWCTRMGCNRHTRNRAEPVHMSKAMGTTWFHITILQCVRETWQTVQQQSRPFWQPAPGCEVWLLTSCFMSACFCWQIQLWWFVTSCRMACDGEGHALCTFVKMICSWVAHHWSIIC